MENQEIERQLTQRRLDNENLLRRLRILENKNNAVVNPNITKTTKPVNNTVVTVPNISTMGFLIGWMGGISLGVDIAGHRPISKSCVPILVQVRCIVAPTITNQIIDILLWRDGVSNSIFTTPLALTAGSFVAITSNFNDINFVLGDYLTITSTQASGTPAKTIFVEILVQ